VTTGAEAIAKAKSISAWTVGMCDQFVARMYGFDSSGYSTAIKNWQATPSTLKHAGDWNAPAGALMYWSGGSTGAGHVAISLGNGQIVSTDAPQRGTVGTVSARMPSDQWGQNYVGWAYPYFQGREATTSLGGWSGSTSAVPVSTTGSQISADSITTGFISGLKAPFQLALSTFMWGWEIVGGIVLILIGIWLMARGVKQTS
jgi:cell wall-associated NlpC family hydrolase